MQRGPIRSRLYFSTAHRPETNQAKPSHTAWSQGRRPLLAAALIPKAVGAQFSFKLSLHLPPSLFHPDYERRCLRCLSFDHETQQCRGPSRCAKFYRIGHKYKGCTQPIDHSFADAPVYGMHICGEENLTLLEDRPDFVHRFLRQSINHLEEVNRLTRLAFVLDTRLVPYFDLRTMHELIDGLRNWDNQEYILAYWGNDRFILLLPDSIEVDSFFKLDLAPLREANIVTYRWNIRVNSSLIELKHKVWLDVYHPPLFSFNFDQLHTVCSSFGLLLDHDPLSNRSDYDCLIVLVGTTDLMIIPKMVKVIAGLCHFTAQLELAGRIEETIRLFVPEDTTPSEAEFELLRNQIEERNQPTQQINDATFLRKHRTDGMDVSSDSSTDVGQAPDRVWVDIDHLKQFCESAPSSFAEIAIELDIDKALQIDESNNPPAKKSKIDQEGQFQTSAIENGEQGRATSSDSFEHWNG